MLTNPLHVSFVMGVESGMPTKSRGCRCLLEELPVGAHWQVIGIGRQEVWQLHRARGQLGGDLRTGLEDTFYLPDGTKASIATASSSRRWPRSRSMPAAASRPRPRRVRCSSSTTRHRCQSAARIQLAARARVAPALVMTGGSAPFDPRRGTAAALAVPVGSALALPPSTSRSRRRTRPVPRPSLHA